MNLPKFLYAKENKRHFIIHTEFPRFIGEFKRNGKYYDMINPEIIDDFPLKSGDENYLAELMRIAGDFFNKKLSNKN